MHVGVLQAYFARPEPGGGERHTEHLARALARRGHDVTVFTDEPRDRRDGIDDLDVRTYPSPRGLKLNPVTELGLARAARVDAEACDVLLLTDESAFRGVDFDVPTAMVFHLVWHGWLARAGVRGVLGKPQALAYAALERRIARRADRVVAISGNVRDDIARIGRLRGPNPAADGRLVPIPNGVDTGRFHPDAGASDDGGPIRVHFQGRLVEQKRPGRLVDAVAASNGDWRLTVGGDGPLREDLEQRVRRAGVGDRVEFLGYVPDADLPARYAASDLFVLPSAYEGMPLTVLEALASGTLVVASPRAATDVVDDTVGRVVEPSPDALARTLDDLARDSGALEAMGARARERALAYDWSQVAVQYEALFEGLVG
ncbi:glycosyltransferase family 4 protein [Haloglomus litoreum]|uniref:glycosyltransferase family 4 protein n=1 Tax=Haloglomus litoreum TaxID=3034026 RepID=UPI0023E8F345|nr:glycosyltransferase family 4 protein [Haloglomus sp. DT116]